AAQIAWDEGISGSPGMEGYVFLGALEEGPDHLEAAVVGRVTRGHRLELPCVKEVQEQRLQGIVSMVPEGNLVRAQALRRRVEDSPAESRAGGAEARGAAGLVHHHRISVLPDDLEGDSKLLEPVFQRSAVVTGLAL